MLSDFAPNVGTPCLADETSAILLNFPFWEKVSNIFTPRQRLEDTSIVGTPVAHGLGKSAFDRNHPLGKSKVVNSHAASLAMGLTRGLADIPCGPKRAMECDVRRAEVLEGIGQIMKTADDTERAVTEASTSRMSESAFDCFAGRLGWMVGMLTGLQQGVEGLVRYDTYAAPKDVYSTIAQLLCECERRLARLSDEMTVLGQKALNDDALQRELRSSKLPTPSDDKNSAAEPAESESEPTPEPTPEYALELTSEPTPEPTPGAPLAAPGVAVADIGALGVQVEKVGTASPPTPEEPTED